MSKSHYFDMAKVYAVALLLLVVMSLLPYVHCQEVSCIPQPFVTGGLNTDSDGGSNAH